MVGDESWRGQRKVVHRRACGSPVASVAGRVRFGTVGTTAVAPFSATFRALRPRVAVRLPMRGAALPATIELIAHSSSRAESPRGISPRGAHRTVLEPLDSHGSCHPVKAAAFHRHHRVPPVSR